jgi:predicted ATPase
MLSKISVDHFKSLSQVEIDFGSITIVCGKNSTGKSNILESLTFIRDAVNSGLEEAASDRHGIESILQWSRSRPYNMDVRVKFIDENESGAYHLKISSKGKEPLVLEEKAHWNSDGNNNVGYSRLKGKVKFQGLEDQFLPIAQMFAANSTDGETILKMCQSQQEELVTPSRNCEDQ